MLEPLYDWVVLEPQYETKTRKVTKQRFVNNYYKEIQPIKGYRGRWPYRKTEEVERGNPSFENYEKDEEYQELISNKVVAVGPGCRWEGVMILPHIVIGDILPPLDGYTQERYFVDGYVLVRERYLPAIIREDEE